MKIGILGSGKVARALLALLNNKGIEIAYIWARDTKKAKQLASIHEVDALTPCEADLHFFAVSDDAIAEVSQKFAELENKVHLSGSQAPDILETSGGASKTGVFWPLRSFASSQNGDWGDSWVFISSSSTKFSDRLVDLARALELNFQVINSEQKAELHMQAVVMNNLVNHLYSICEQRLKEKNLSLEAFYPIIRQTFEGVIGEGPAKNQSGPAARGDVQAVKNQLRLLSDDPVLYSIYKLLSDSIIAQKAESNFTD